MKLAAAYVRDLTDEYINARSHAYGNFDKAVALGWLLADAVQPVGLPIIARGLAYSVGLKARRADTAIATNEANIKKDTSRAKSKLPAGDEGRQQLEVHLQKAIAAALEPRVDVGLDDVWQPASQPPVAKGSRKRAREAVTSEPSLDDKCAEAEAQVLKTEKAVKRAEAALTRAENREQEDAAKVQRLTASLNEESTSQTFSRAHDAMHRWDVAVLESRDAEVDLWEARYDDMRAEADSLNMQLERASALSARMDEIHEKQIAALKEQVAVDHRIIQALKGRVAELEGRVEI